LVAASSIDLKMWGRSRLLAPVLAPILLPQGLYARRITPNMAEPTGARHGHSGTGPALRLLILGDSAAAGVGVTTQDQALSGHLVAALAQHYSVSWRLLARTGDTSEQVIEHLNSLESQTFDVAMVSVGVNDVTGRTRDRDWRLNLAGIIANLQARFAVRHILFSGLPPMHIFPALPQPLRWWIGQRARELDSLMQEVATQHANCQHFSTPVTFDHSYMADDGFHPGPLAYTHWGEHTAALIREQFPVDGIPN